jgi:hypothetical protein
MPMPRPARREWTTLESELPPDAVMQLGTGYWGSKTLLSAVELGRFPLLDAAPLSAETIRDRLGLHRRAIHDFLDAPVALDMLEKHAGVYSNTPASSLSLDRSKDTYVGGILEMFNAASTDSGAT